jgi:hypothetical protein
MINNTDELLELVDLYHTYIKRVLFIGLAVSLAYGGYKYGFNAGIDRATEWYRANLEAICSDGKEQSRLPLNDGAPGKMWEPEA